MVGDRGGMHLDLVTRRFVLRFVREFERAASTAETLRERDASVDRFIASLRPWLRVTAAAGGPPGAGAVVSDRVPKTCRFFAAWLRATEASDTTPRPQVNRASATSPVAPMDERAASAEDWVAPSKHSNAA